MVFLFDLDNTLLDDNAAQKKYLPVLYNRFQHSIHCSFDEFSNRWKDTLPKYHQLYAEGRITFEEQRFLRVKESFNNNLLTLEELRRITSCFDELFADSWSLFPDTQEVLQHLKEYKLGIITNGSSTQQLLKINRTAIRHYFDCIVISEEVGVAKPNPAIFHYACKLLNCNPSDCYFIGDSWENDIEGSRRAGMKAVWYNHNNKPLPDNQTSVYVIYSLKEILKLTNH